MNLEFHYYVIAYLSGRAGFDPHTAERLAYSSQLVDSSVIGYTIDTPTGQFQTLIGQNYGFWDDQIIRDVYLPFHFLPGLETEPMAQRMDGAANPFSVRADSPLAKAALVAALSSANVYRIGVALHAFADSFAHQGFTGYHEDWNRLSPDNLIPWAGHAQALTSPDRLEVSWEDSRLVPQVRRIVNRQRFLQAAKKIYRYLRTYLRRDFADEDFVLSDLEAIWGPPGAEKSLEERILDYRIACELPAYDRRLWLNESGIHDSGEASDLGFVGYDKLLWARGELRARLGYQSRKRLSLERGFLGSDFHSWCLAGQAHRDFVQSYIRERGYTI